MITGFIIVFIFVLFVAILAAAICALVFGLPKAKIPHVHEYSDYLRDAFIHGQSPKDYATWINEKENMK